MYKILKYIGILILIIDKTLKCIGILILLSPLIGALNYAGFCFKTMGYLSNEEKVRSAVNFMIEDRWKRISDRNPDLKREDDWFWKDVDSFLTDNPECCEVGITFTSGSAFYQLDRRILPAICGLHSAQVYIRYQIPYAEQIRNTGRYQKSKEIIAITNCGNAWNYRDN